METKSEKILKRALSSVDGKTWEQGGRDENGKTLPSECKKGWPTTAEERDSVVKLVVGSLDKGKAEGDWTNVIDVLSSDIAKYFPKLTHLHVWGLKELKNLGSLPENLKVLDVRKCENVRLITNIPETVEELVLGQLPKLIDVPEVGEFTDLDDLEIAFCPKLPGEGAGKAAWPVQVMLASPVVRKVNLSGHPGIQTIYKWPEDIVDLRLNECANLIELPAWWPVDLRRLELRGCCRIEMLEDLDEPTDFVDLGGMESLKELPKAPSKMKTLYLYGSGIMMPPASEHGSGVADNVAQSTREFFEEVDLFGKGEVRRCKVLMLGNGSAGKTCLSLALNPDADPGSDDWGSTHGVRFDSWDFLGRINGKQQKVNGHIWDFGGQEIYHNTHRLFMEKGSVFVILWKPEQDGKQAPVDDHGYQDDWRPLKYWIDFVRMACPHRAEIVIVCSHREKPDEDLRAEAARQLGGEEIEKCHLFFVDSKKRGGEFEPLKGHLEAVIAETVERQGVGVPSHWEVAQVMAKDWLEDLKNKETPALEKVYTSVDKFGEELTAFLPIFLKRTEKHLYKDLKKALENGNLELDTKRLRRVLGFLTNSGWLYWNPRLSEDEVIVGQQWVLDGIYAALERRKGTPVYLEMIRRIGRFTRKDLPEPRWKRRSDEEQRLLVSFMKLTGMCFPLVNADESMWGEEVLVSINHLRTADAMRFEHQFSTAGGALDCSEPIEFRRDTLHTGHWHAILACLGRYFGVGAEYAKDGFFLPETEKGQAALISCQIDEKKGIGGFISIEVNGPDNQELLQELREVVEQKLPGGEGAYRGESPLAGKYAGKSKPSDQMRIFFSYSWNPKEEGEKSVEYEKPVDVVYNALSKESSIKVLRDKVIDFSGGNLLVSQFMNELRSCDKVLVFHSQKYWESGYCMWEMYATQKMFQRSKKDPKSTMVLVQVEESGLKSISSRNQLDELWKERRTSEGYDCRTWMANLTPPVQRKEDLVDFAMEVIRWMPDLSDPAMPQLIWKEGDEVGLIEGIKKKMGLNPPTPKEGAGTDE